jgi:YHS domain-containing protein
LMRRGGMACGMGSHRHAANDLSTQERGRPRDPVNGHPVSNANAVTSVFEGQTYSFESEQSRAEFQKNPQHFAHNGAPRHHRGC